MQYPMEIALIVFSSHIYVFASAFSQKSITI